MARISRTRVACGALAGGALVAAATLSATPAQAQEDEDSTTANVTVDAMITITDLTESFDLVGEPGDEVTTDPSVSLTVTTNAETGYTVTVEPDDEDLVPADPVENEDVIPFSDLEVELQDESFTPLTPGTPIEIYSEEEPTDDTGDLIEHDYQITIPFVNPDTYSGDITYIAAVNE